LIISLKSMRTHLMVSNACRYFEKWGYSFEAAYEQNGITWVLKKDVVDFENLLISKKTNEVYFANHDTFKTEAEINKILEKFQTHVNNVLQNNNLSLLKKQEVNISKKEVLPFIKKENDNDDNISD
jgi:predicted nucleotide-binding protein (sugar kinase/HSP70/actin superfamily)